MGYIMFGTFFVLILLRVPVSLSIGASAVVTFLFSDFSNALQIIPQQMLQGAEKSSLLAVPFFILAGNLMNTTGATERIFAFAESLVGHFRAGLAQVNILSSVIFAGISGAAVADCAGLGAVEIKAMRERGYKPDFAAAVTVASAVVGPLIPPSVGMILYAFLSGQSIQRMFIAGLGPGLLVAAALMIYVRLRAGKEHFPVQPRATARQVVTTGRHGLAALIAPAIILGAILSGWVTATEAGVLASLYCLALGLIYRSLTFKGLMRAMADTASMSSVIMMIIAFSIVMGWLLAIDQTPQKISEALFALTEQKWIFLGLLIVFLLLTGCVVEGVPATLILVPTLLPVIDAYGVDRVQFGVILNLGLLIGIATPPMGIGLYIVSEVGRVRFEHVSRAVLPFLVPLIVVLVLVTYVPGLSTFLPDLLLGPDLSAR